MKLEQIVLELVNTSDNVVASFTKALGGTKLAGIVNELGMHMLAYVLILVTSTVLHWERNMGQASPQKS